MSTLGAKLCGSLQLDNLFLTLTNIINAEATVSLQPVGGAVDEGQTVSVSVELGLPSQGSTTSITVTLSATTGSGNVFKCSYL